MKNYIQIAFILLAVAGLMYLAFIEGRNSAKKEIEDRAKNSSNIEVIIFGEKQL